MGVGARHAGDLRLHHVVFTDIEGSTPRWEREPEVMRRLVREHDEVLDALVADAGGEVLKRTGDGLVGMFADADAAVGCAVAMQHAFDASDGGLAIRIGVHSGLLEARHGDLHGPPMNRAARIMGCANAQQIVVSAAIRDACRLPGLDFRPLGHHRLKGLTQPEELYQVIAPGLRVEFGPLSSLNRTAGFLPAMPGHLIGRDDDVVRIEASLRPGALVSLVGPSGVGKTRLAVHCGDQVRSLFPDGVWFVDLAAVTDAEHVLTAVAVALRVERGQGYDLEARIRERCATTRMLVVLDNCEHVLAAVVGAVRTLHGATSPTAFLATTQRRLGLPDEVVLRVDPLPVVATAEAAPAVKLFVERAQAADPTFSLSTANRDAVVTICTALDGLPLAIELAAARCTVLSPAEIAGRLDDRFALLRRRDGAERHQTLANAIGWSYDLLTPSEQRLLRSLAVFQGAFDMTGAATIAGGDGVDDLDTVDDLSELVDRSLVTRDGSELRLLDSVRRFAVAKAREAGEFENRLARHADWVAAMAGESIDDPDVDVAARNVERLARRHSDLRLGLTTLLGTDPTRGAAAVLGFLEFWTARDLGDEALEWLTSACGRVDDPSVRVELLGWMCAFAWVDGRNAEAERFGTQGLDEASAHGLPFPPLAGSRVAVQLVFRGESAAAMELVEAALVAIEHDPAQRARLLGPLAVVVAVSGDVRRAVALADEGIALSREIGAIRTIAALGNRAILTPGELDNAAIAAEMAAIAERLGRPSGRAQALLAVAHCERAAGNVGGFLRRLADCAELLYASNQRTSVALVLDFVPDAIAPADPAGAATMLGAAAHAHEVVAQRGMTATVKQLEDLEARLRGTLGDTEFETARGRGAVLGLDGAVDMLRWIGQSWDQS